MVVTQTNFRYVMGNFTTGCTVVTQPGTPPHGMTANAFASVSLDPPLCLICVDNDTQMYERFQNGIESFAISVLAENQRDIAEYFAGMTELEENPFESRKLQTFETGTPVFEESLAFVDCTVDAVHPGGDHTIFVGKAEAAGVLNEDDSPLTFFRGDWGTLAEE